MSEEIKNELNNENKTNIDNTANSSDETKNTEEQTQEVDNKIPYDRFKAKVDEANALKEKLAEIEKANEEAERKKLEEQNEYKKLYEQAQEQAEQAKQEALATKKSAQLAQAGYSEEQTRLLAKLVEGETDEEISESIKLLKTTIPAQDNYGDPSPMNGKKSMPEPTDQTDVGRNAVSRVLHKIKL